MGEQVTVREEHFATRWVKPHLRTPGYLFGKTGVVERICGTFQNPETAAFRVETMPQPLYRVRFRVLLFLDVFATRTPKARSVRPLFQF